MNPWVIDFIRNSPHAHLLEQMSIDTPLVDSVNVFDTHSEFMESFQQEFNSETPLMSLAEKGKKVELSQVTKRFLSQVGRTTEVEQEIKEMEGVERRINTLRSLTYITALVPDLQLTEDDAETGKVKNKNVKFDFELKNGRIVFHGWRLPKDLSEEILQRIRKHFMDRFDETFEALHPPKKK